jgi:beta-lactamase regulating signal transducer with metallopeptidase domain
MSPDLVRHALGVLATAVRWSDAVAEWLLTYAIHSTILIGVIWLVTSGPLARRLRITSSAGLWLFALGGGVVTSLLQSLGALNPIAGTLRLASDLPSRATIRYSAAGSTIRLSVEENRSPGRPTVGARSGVHDGAANVVTADVHVVASPTLTPRFPARALSPLGPTSFIPRASAFVPRPSSLAFVITPIWPLAVSAGWIAGAILMLALFRRSRSRFFRTLATRQLADRTPAGVALREVMQRAGVRRRVTLTVAERLSSPVAIGPDEICLPRRALMELDPIQQESILAHELAHLERRDPLALLLARVIEAVCFFQPLNHLARRRMQEAAEFASDAWAVRAVPRPVQLARCLARVAEWTVAGEPLAVPGMAERQGSVLVRRVQRLTDSDARPETGVRGRTGRLALTATFLAMALFAPRATIGSPGRTGPAPRVGQMLILERSASGNLTARTPVGAGRVFFQVRRAP